MSALRDRHIEITPDIRRGKPRIAVADIVILHRRLGHALEEITAIDDLELASVYAAMALYYDHRAAIDRSIEEDEAFIEASPKNNPSLLQERLIKLRDA